MNAVKLIVTGGIGKEKNLLRHIENQAEIKFQLIDNAKGSGKLIIEMNVDEGMEILHRGDIVDKNSLCILTNTEEGIEKAVLNTTDKFCIVNSQIHNNSLHLTFTFNGKIGSTLGKTDGTKLEDLIN